MSITHSDISCPKRSTIQVRFWKWWDKWFCLNPVRRLPYTTAEYQSGLEEAYRAGWRAAKRQQSKS